MCLQENINSLRLTEDKLGYEGVSLVPAVAVAVAADMLFPDAPETYSIALHCFIHNIHIFVFFKCYHTQSTLLILPT